MISVDYTFWEILRDGPQKELGRTYTFTGLSGPNSHTVIQLRIRLSTENDRPKKWLSWGSKAQPRPFIYLIIQPYIFEQLGWAIAQLGPSRENNLEHPFFNVKIEPIASGGNFILIDSDHAQRCLDILAQCEQLTLRLLGKSGDVLAIVPLENDVQFRIAYVKFLFELGLEGD